MRSNCCRTHSADAFHHRNQLALLDAHGVLRVELIGNLPQYFNQLGVRQRQAYDIANALFQESPDEFQIGIADCGDYRQLWVKLTDREQPFKRSRQLRSDFEHKDAGIFQSIRRHLCVSGQRRQQDRQIGRIHRLDLRRSHFGLGQYQKYRMLIQIQNPVLWYSV